MEQILLRAEVPCGMERKGAKPTSFKSRTLWYGKEGSKFFTLRAVPCGMEQILLRAEVPCGMERKGANSFL